MAFLRALNLAIRFLLELASLAAVGFWGATLSSALWLRIVSALALPSIVAVFWGLFVSPKARVPTGRFGRATLGLVVFLVAALTLWNRGHAEVALSLAVVALLSSIAVFVLPQ